MRIGQRGITLIRDFESCRLVGYLPTPDDVPTIGWGHTGPEVYVGLVWTQELADATLEIDLRRFENYVNELVTVPLTQGQFDALVSFCYNVGQDIDADNIAEGLGDSTLLKRLNAGDYIGASSEFAKWTKQKGKILGGLVRRRHAERKLFDTPDEAIA